MTDAEVLRETNVPGLDLILGGGLHPHSLTLIIGSPGAGKTVLASQIAFGAGQSDSSLILTSYSEGNDQYLGHIRGFTFFEPSLFGDRVKLFSLQSLLSADTGTTATTVVRAIRTSGARIVVIDGIQSMFPLFGDTQSLRAFLSTLSTQLRYLNITLLLTLSGDARDPLLQAVVTIADVVIGLEYRVHGRRHQRLLEVIKQRGRSQLPGLHSYLLDSSGMRIFPRIEAYPPPTPQIPENTRISFGLPELDALLGGGLNTGTTTLLAGAPGVGKTTLALSWGVNDARPDAQTLFVSFSEFPEQLQRKAAAFGIDLEGALNSGVVRIIRMASTDLVPDYLAHLLLTEIATGTITRFVCDDIAILLHELGDRARDYFSALNDILYHTNCTSLYLLEIPAFDGLRINVTNTPLATLGDNMVVVQQYETEGVLRRILAVLRMKLSFFDRTLRELVLDEDGIRVVALEKRVLGLLESGTRLSRGSPQSPDAPSEGELGEAG